MNLCEDPKQEVGVVKDQCQSVKSGTLAVRESENFGRSLRQRKVSNSQKAVQGQ